MTGSTTNARATPPTTTWTWIELDAIASLVFHDQPSGYPSLVAGGDEVLLLGAEDPRPTELAIQATVEDLPGPATAGSPGDLDDDGHDDLSVTEDLDGPDAVLVFSGPLEGSWTPEDTTARVLATGLHLVLPAGSGDADADGQVDLVFGDPSSGSQISNDTTYRDLYEGAVWLLPGPTSTW